MLSSVSKDLALAKQDTPTIQRKGQKPTELLSLSHYKEISEKKQNGFSEIIHHKGKKLMFTSANFSNVPFKNIWDMLSFAKPDLIVV